MRRRAAPPERDDASSVVLGPMASRPDGQACQTRIQSTFIVWGSLLSRPILEIS
jgi:hypothetical protein